MPQQLRLHLNRTPAYRRQDFVVSRANAAGVGGLETWRMWPAGVAALVGPQGSGKTHLAKLWAQDSGAVQLDAPPADFDALHGRTVLIEQAEAWPDDEALFHLINMAAAGGALLLTSRQAPRDWPAALPDLRSRLNAMPVIELAPPDDEALAGVLMNLFRQRNIVPAADLIPYLLARMDRSFSGAERTATLLDEAAAARGREVNRALAIQVLEVDNLINDLLG